jgi:hypothetical protein
MIELWFGKKIGNMSKFMRASSHASRFFSCSVHKSRVFHVLDLFALRLMGAAIRDTEMAMSDVP